MNLLKEIKNLKAPIALMAIILTLFLYSNLAGYRLLDVFGSDEWQRDGPPGAGGSGGYHSGHHSYFHK